MSEFWHLQMFRSKDKEGNPIVYDPLGALKAKSPAVATLLLAHLSFGHLGYRF